MQDGCSWQREQQGKGMERGAAERWGGVIWGAAEGIEGLGVTVNQQWEGSGFCVSRVSPSPPSQLAPQDHTQTSQSPLAIHTLGDVA